MTDKSLLDCTDNTRELGGIRTSAGITKNNVYWRSDVPVEPTAADVEKLILAHITEIVDMRTEEECLKKTCGFADKCGFRYHHFPITEGSGVPESLPAVPLSYMDIALAENMPKIWKVIAESENGVLFHCTAGKDRTGVVSAIILMICSVEREDIVSNYTVSREYNRKKLEAFLAANPQVDRDIVLANEYSMNRFIDLFTGNFGTVEHYFEAIGLPSGYAEMIRNKLTR